MPPIELACIIDDDPVFVYGTKMMMQMASFAKEIMNFENGQDALEALEPLVRQADLSKIPDIILVDLNMPIMDGWQFIDEFTKIPCQKKVKLFIVTSSVDQEDRNRASRYQEVSSYVVKPLTLETLKEMKQAS